MRKKQLIYISAFIPFGKTESFVLEEACAVKEFYENFLNIPRNPPKEIFHEKAKDLAKATLKLPLFNWAIISKFITSLFSKKTQETIAEIVCHSRSFRTALKNF